MDDLALSRTQREGTWITVGWSGDIDMSNAAAIERASLAVVDNQDDGLTIDLSDVDYIDSAGIRSIVQIWRLLGERQQRLQMILPPDSLLRRGLEIGGITSFVANFPTLEDARASR